MPPQLSQIRRKVSTIAAIIDGMTKSFEETPRAELPATQDGRLTIPVQVRRAAGIEPGQTLVVYVEAGRVVLEERSHLLTRIQDEAIAAAQAAGHTGSAVDELIADRRAEAAREDASPNATVDDPWQASA
jgi:bifunctional DNA-binding transcriptional regulator/antitoxin component of YhaV-PrlF toxin-antitoxin module